MTTDPLPLKSSYTTHCPHFAVVLPSTLHLRFSMYRFWAACLVQVLFGVLACASTGGGETNITRALSFSINSEAVDRLVEYLSHEEKETHWWRMVDVTDATISEVLILWDITHEELHERSQLRGNASAMHIYAYLETKKLLENSTCARFPIRSWTMDDCSGLTIRSH